MGREAWAEANERFPEHTYKERKKVETLARRRDRLDQLARDHSPGDHFAAEAGAIRWALDRLEELEYES